MKNARTVHGSPLRKRKDKPSRKWRGEALRTIALASVLLFMACADDSSTSTNDNVVDSGTCEDLCVPRQRQCVTGGYQPCGDFDGDPCLEWGPVVPCNAGEECIEGQCEPVAALDECIEGAVMCSTDGTGIRPCEYRDNPGIWVWGNVINCEVDETCSCGRCRSTCTNECADGATRCWSSGYQICGDHDGDSCTDWGPLNDCPGDQTCSNGVCATDCFNECTAGSLRCACSGSMVQECGNFDADACLEWSPASPCPLGETCSNGVCSESCQNECEPQGDTGCNPAGTGIKECDDYNEDGCLEWGPVSDCPGEQTCQDGVCDDYCTCDKEIGICEADSPNTTTPCSCDPDCGTPCQADGYCDYWCDPGADDDCGCICDFNEYCEAEAQGSSTSCPCDIDCELHEYACSDDGHCDSFCPSGVDPDCGEDPCRPRYMRVGYRNADETTLAGSYTNPDPNEGAPWVLLSPGVSGGSSEFYVGFSAEHVSCVTEIRIKVWGYDDATFGDGAEISIWDWNNERYDLLPDETIGSTQGFYTNTAINPLPYMLCGTGQYAKCYIDVKINASGWDNTHYWDAYVDVYMSP